jgi:hypothetical protein
MIRTNGRREKRSGCFRRRIPCRAARDGQRRRMQWQPRRAAAVTSTTAADGPTRARGMTLLAAAVRRGTGAAAMAATSRRRGKGERRKGNRGQQGEQPSRNEALTQSLYNRRPDSALQDHGVRFAFCKLNRIAVYTGLLRRANRHVPPFKVLAMALVEDAWHCWDRRRPACMLVVYSRYRLRSGATPASAETALHLRPPASCRQVCELIAGGTPAVPGLLVGRLPAGTAATVAESG